MRKSTIISITILIFLYVLTYGLFRQSNIEIWEKDGKEYVIYPSDKIYIYYLYRPLSVIVNKLTGMNSHIGQHR